jgi:hypothetical protein
VTQEVRTLETVIPVHAEVFCADGLCGESTGVVVNPVSRQVTHVVVQPSPWTEQERMVPAGDVADSFGGALRLHCASADLLAMEPFVRGEHAPGEVPFLVYQPGEYMMLPYMEPDGGLLLAPHAHVPPGELAVQKGTQVHAMDGRVGQVDEFLVDPADGCITHLVLREGHLWGQKDVTIPVSEIDAFDEHAVHLKLRKRAIEALPAIPLRRGL